MSLLFSHSISDLSDRFYSVTQEPDFLFPLPETRNHYESEDLCQVCSCKFAVSGLAHTQKHFCYFCYHATCTRCLSFDYFHTDFKSIRPMCTNCHNKLLTLSENFKLELEKYRLERIELKKEVKIAISEKDQAIKERQILAEKVKILKENCSLTKNDQELALEALNNKKRELKAKISEYIEKNNDFGFNYKLLSQRLQGLRSFMSSYVVEREVEFKEYEKAREEYNTIVSKIAFLKNELSKEEPTEGDICNRTGDLTNEIEVLSESIKETEKKIRKTEKKLKKVKKRVDENALYIDELMDKLKDPNIPATDGLNAEEKQTLAELRKQVRELDDIIRAVSNRRDLTLETMERKTAGFLDVYENDLLDADQDPNSRLSYRNFPDPATPKQRNPKEDPNKALSTEADTKKFLKSKKPKEKQPKDDSDSKSRGCDLCSKCSII